MGLLTGQNPLLVGAQPQPKLQMPTPPVVVPQIPLPAVAGTATAEAPKRKPFDLFSPEGSALMAQLGQAFSPEGNAFTQQLAGVANQGAQGALQSQYANDLRQNPQAQAPRFMDPTMATEARGDARSEREERMNFAERMMKMQKLNLDISQSPEQFRNNQAFIQEQITGMQQKRQQEGTVFPDIQQQNALKTQGMQRDVDVQTATQDTAIAKAGLTNEQLQAQTASILQDTAASESLLAGQKTAQGLDIEAKGLANKLATDKLAINQKVLDLGITEQEAQLQLTKARTEMTNAQAAYYKNRPISGNPVPFSVTVMEIMGKYLTKEQQEEIGLGLMKSDHSTLYYTLNAEDQTKFMAELHTKTGMRYDPSGAAPVIDVPATTALGTKDDPIFAAEGVKPQDGKYYRAGDATYLYQNGVPTLVQN